MQYKTFFPTKLVHAIRLLLGLLFFIFGLNGFFHFLPQPEVSGSVAQFMGALAQSGYMLPLVFASQLIVGILLLANRLVPLALILLAPLTVNIIAFHLAMDPDGIVPGAVAAVLQIYLLFAYLPNLSPVLQLKPTPVSDQPSNPIKE